MKKIDKTYLKLCKRLFFILPKLRKYSTDRLIALAINSSVNIDFKQFMEDYNICFNEISSKLFYDLDSIVRGLLPYLTEDSIMSLCSLGGKL